MSTVENSEISSTEDGIEDGLEEGEVYEPPTLKRTAAVPPEETPRAKKPKVEPKVPSYIVLNYNHMLQALVNIDRITISRTTDRDRRDQIAGLIRELKLFNIKFIRG
jgi:hypothetical protein